MSSEPRRRALALLAQIALFAVVLALGARAHLSLPAGRRAVGDALEALLTSELRGTARIGSVEVARTDLVLARDVAFSTPEGEEVLSFREIELDPDLRRLVEEGTIATRYARVRGARLLMVEREGEDGLGVERAFDSPGPDDGEDGVAIDFSGIAFQDLDSEWRIGDAPVFHLDDASGLARIYTDDDGNIAMRFDRISASARTEGLPFDVRADIDRASGRIRTGWRELGRFEIAMRVIGSDVDIDLDLIDGEGGVRPRIHTDTEPGSLAMFAALGAELVTSIAGAPEAVNVGRRDDGDDSDDSDDDDAARDEQEAK